MYTGKTTKVLEMPDNYLQDINEEGNLVKIEYLSKSYKNGNYDIRKEAIVYLPYGYSEDISKKYNVFYLMHGGGGNCDEVFGGIKGDTKLKCILDNMVKNGLIENTIVVTPSFYYETNKDAKWLSQMFHLEFLNDLIPTVESEFNVYRTRESRAFGGYSMGANVTWNILCNCLKEVKYYMPMSGDCWAIETVGGLNKTKETVDYLVDAIKNSNPGSNNYMIKAYVGDIDVAYEPLNTMAEEMSKRKEYFNKDNFRYLVANGGTHSYEYCYKYIYDCLPQFFK